MSISIIVGSSTVPNNSIATYEVDFQNNPANSPDACDVNVAFLTFCCPGADGNPVPGPSGCTQIPVTTAPCNVNDGPPNCAACTGPFAFAAAAPDPTHNPVVVTGLQCLVNVSPGVLSAIAQARVDAGYLLCQADGGVSQPALPKQVAVQVAQPTDTPTNTPTITLTPTNAPTSTPTPLCGNGVIDPGETCDPPGSIPDTPPGNINPCRSDCTYCGDAVANGGETCDSGTSLECAGPPRCHVAGPQACTRCIARDPVTIRFHSGSAVNDRLRLHGRWEADHSIDPTTVVVGIRLSNANDDVYYSADLPVGAVTLMKGATPSRTVFEFRNATAQSNPYGGIALFKLSRDKQWYRVTAEVYGNISAATAPQMTIEVVFGKEHYTSSGTWTRTATGWWFQNRW